MTPPKEFIAFEEATLAKTTWLRSGMRSLYKEGEQDNDADMGTMTARLIYYAEHYHVIAKMKADALFWRDELYRCAYHEYMEAGKSATQCDHLATCDITKATHVLADVEALEDSIRESKSCIQSVLRTKSDEMKHNDWLEGTH